MKKPEDKGTKAEFFLGKFGGAIPIISMFLMLAAMSIMGLTNGKNFWAAAMAAILLAFILIKDKSKFQDILVEGLCDSMLGMILLTFFVSGILSVLLTIGGLCDGLVYLAVRMHVPSGIMPAVVFILCELISTSTGTTSGTIIAATPVLLPLAYNLGCSPALVMGAIVSGGYFGDNLAPVSDTTIASASTQETDIMDVVKSRFKYSVVAGLISLALYIYLGFTTSGAPMPGAGQDPQAVWGILLLACPILLVVLMLKGKNFVYALVVAIFLAMVIDIGLGKLTLNTFFASDGVVAQGIDNCLSSAVLCMLVFIIMQVLKASGAFERLSELVVKVCKSHKQAEAIVGVLAMLGSCLMGGATYSIVLSGGLSRSLLKSYHIQRSRGANLLDGLACGAVGLLPYAGAVLVAVSQAISTGVVDDSFTAMAFIPYTFHCMGLVVVYWVSIITGWGSNYEYMDKEGVYHVVKRKEDIPAYVFEEDNA